VLGGSPRDRISTEVSDRQLEQRLQNTGTFEPEQVSPRRTPETESELTTSLREDVDLERRQSSDVRQRAEVETGRTSVESTLGQQQTSSSPDTTQTSEVRERAESDSGGPEPSRQDQRTIDNETDNASDQRATAGQQVQPGLDRLDQAQTPLRQQQPTPELETGSEIESDLRVDTGLEVGSGQRAETDPGSQFAPVSRVRAGQEFEQELGQEVGQELGQDLEQEVGQEVGQEIDQGLGQEVNQEIGQELNQELEQDLEQRTETETETQQELEQEIELEFETDLEQRQETEAEPFGEDDRDNENGQALGSGLGSATFGTGFADAEQALGLEDDN
jgi:hypothetical protein